MVKRAYRLREGDQIPTSLVTINEIMSDPTFALGVADARAGRPYHPDYDVWRDCNLRWSYERGRQWATLTPRHVALKVDGRLNPEAVGWYARHVTSIIGGKLFRRSERRSVRQNDPRAAPAIMRERGQ